MACDPQTEDRKNAQPDCDLHQLVDAFVELHGKAPRQRSAAWLAKKQFVVGGSELAALIGWSPYSSFEKVLGQKCCFPAWAGNVACRWGTFFEAVCERLLEIDCGTRVSGTDIHVDAGWLGYRGHANSPDGYCVLNLVREKPGQPAGSSLAGQWAILHTDQEINAARHERRATIVLLEFKAPYSRRPKAGIPRHYRPQVWSGLDLSPMAEFGLYVDTVFRICALEDLGDTPEYNASYHRRDKQAWGRPVAWGMSAVYAPVLGRRTHLTKVPGEAGHEAWRMRYSYFGLLPDAETVDPIDFGSCSAQVFDAMLGYVDSGAYRARHVDPRFADGRGNLFDGSAVALLSAEAPAGCYLLGIIPWKVFEINYVPVPRNPGFLASVQDQIEELVALAEQIRAAAVPADAYASLCRERAVAKQRTKQRAEQQTGRSKPGRPAQPAATAAEIQDLFDSLS